MAEHGNCGLVSHKEIEFGKPVGGSAVSEVLYVWLFSQYEPLKKLSMSTSATFSAQERAISEGYRGVE